MGNRLPSTPETSSYKSLGYDFQLAGFDASARADLYWVASQWRAANNERRSRSHESVAVKLMVHNKTNHVGYQFGRTRSYGLHSTTRVKKRTKADSA